MKEIKTLFIDCDGVLYDKKNLTYYDMAVVAFHKALSVFDISAKEAVLTGASLKKKNIHGFFNMPLALCKKKQIPFRAFADTMANSTDYSHIPADKSLLKLLKEAGKIMPVYIVTNNTRPHLNHILKRLNGDKPIECADLNIYPITVEETLYNGQFHTKRNGNQLTHLCESVGQKPKNVLLLDDTQNVCDAALAQGLKVFPITGPKATKLILKGVIHEKSKLKGHLPVRQTRGGAGTR